MMSLSGCLTNTKEIPILPQDNLLVSPCEGKTKFKTPRELGNIHLDNLGCIDKYEASLEALRKWKRDKQDLYKVSPNNKEK